MRKLLLIISLFSFLFSVGQTPMSKLLRKHQSTAATYLFDTYASTAGYSLRKLKTGATNAVRIRRSSDDAEQDIGFVSGNFDSTSFSSFIGAGHGYVKTWFDQSGNGYDVTQSTSANQPELLLSQFGSLPAIQFVATNNQMLSHANFLGSVTAATLFGVVKTTEDPPASITNAGMWITATGDASNPQSFYPLTNGYLYDCFGTNVRKFCGDPTPDLTNLHLYCTISASNDWRNYINNSSFYTTLTNTVSVTTDFKIGTQDGYYNYNGKLGEVIVFDNAVSDADRTAISNNINTYYSIY